MNTLKMAAGIVKWAEASKLQLTGEQANALLMSIAELVKPPVSEPTGGAIAETDVEMQVQVEADRFGGQLWRNNSGACTDNRGIPVRFGLGNTSAKLNKVYKSSDYIGCLPMVVQPSWVGKRVGIFTMAELKAPGWKLLPGDKRGIAQANFMRLGVQAGGIGTFASDVTHFREAVLNWSPQ